MIDPKVYQENGGLYSLGWYLSWEVGQKKATLDGEFTADELAEIAAHMKETDGKEKGDGASGGKATKATEPDRDNREGEKKEMLDLNLDEE